MESNFNTIILSGGSGTRFAPLSTEQKPKQFLSIIDSRYTMIQETCSRIENFVLPDHSYVSTQECYVSLVREQLPHVTRDHIIDEPLKKNTAPAIALMAHLIYLKNKEAVLLFLPSDHYIHDVNKARQVFIQALRYASQNDNLITFGIPPDFPSSDYGYICFDKSEAEFKAVKSFVEKPDVKTAQEYIKQGNYYWNSGIFVWRADVILHAIQEHLPDMYALLCDLFKTPADVLDVQKKKHYFEQVQSISIDYGVMEHAKNVVMTPFDVGWSDVGTWKGLDQLQKKYNLALPEQTDFYLKEYRSGRLS